MSGRHHRTFISLTVPRHRLFSEKQKQSRRGILVAEPPLDPAEAALDPDASQLGMVFWRQQTANALRFQSKAEAKTSQAARARQ